MTSVPVGEGLVARRVRLAKGNVYVLGGILAGEDHLASIHGESIHGESVHGEPLGDADARVTVSVVTTEARAAELDAWLDDLTDPLALERLP